VIPSELLNRDHWPHETHQLFDKFGPEIVWAFGLDVNEFPPTWGIDSRQLAAIHRRILAAKG
jgi:hypothetical protein